MVNFFADPVLRAPLLGSMLMCLASSLLGVLLFVRKKSLLAETLSHATYPGVVSGVLLGALFGSDEGMPFFIIGCGFCSALLGAFAIDLLKKRLHLREDSALCLVLAAFFGLGVTLASRVQFLFPKETRSIHGYLYGQAATMNDFHIYLYGSFALLILLVLFLFYKEFFTLSFDAGFAKATGVANRWVDTLFLTLVTLSVVIGVRCVGVVLMSAMLIAPPIGARRLTHSLRQMFLFAGLIALVSAFVGCQISFHLSTAFPTGPMIVLIASGFAFLSLFFSPTQGLVVRYFRILSFRLQCMQENLLKTFWRKSSLSFSEMNEHFPLFALLYTLFSLHKKGFIEHKKKSYHITPAGFTRAAVIVRLHRLWEVYLVEYLGVGAERVHKSAEEMEHILTPELERELTKLLKDPIMDPHDQPIPARGESYV